MARRPSPTPSLLVRSGWDAASRRYRPDDPERDDIFGHPRKEYLRWLRPVLDRVPPRSPVLDLGCGCGVPTAEILSRRFRLTGVDISPVQIERARALLPNVRFLRADMTRVRFPKRAFRAVVCLYSLIHVSLRYQRGVLRRVHDWLVPGGPFVLIAGHTAYEGTEADWLGSGAPMYWSHADERTYRAWLEDAGFRIDRQEFVPEGTGGHELFWAVAGPRGHEPKPPRSSE